MNRVLDALMPGASLRSRHVTVRNLWAIRRNYGPVATGLVEPFLYLLSIGIGVGALVGDVEYGGQNYDYRTFVAPAMLAAAAMNGAVSESTFNIFAKIRWDKIYQAFVATPLTPSDIALGELLFAQLRGTVYSAAFLVTMLGLGLIESWWAVLALPTATLIGITFSAAGLVAATWLRKWEDSDAIILVQVVLFLFSATFFPLSVYPDAVQLVVQVSPLYHGVALCRNLVLGTVGLADLGHALYLIVLAVLLIRLAGHRFKVLLYDGPAA